MGGVKYRTIVADPPWEIPKRMGAGGRRKRTTEVPYEFMSLAQIMALPIEDMADDAAHLYLWSTRRNFREGIAAAVARAWGFEPCGELIWGLKNGGMGGVNGIHSAKPDGLHLAATVWLLPHDLAERLSPSPRLELFARRQRLGWDTWGNEALEHVSIYPPNYPDAADPSGPPSTDELLGGQAA